MLAPRPNNQGLCLVQGFAVDRCWANLGMLSTLSSIALSVTVGGRQMCLAALV